VISNPRHTCAVYNIANPPGESEITQLSERLEMSAAFELVSYREGTIPTITAKGLIITPMIDLTHINPKLLPYALKQEATDEAAEPSTLDLRAWTHLPKIIKDHWRRFNIELRKHIMDCMEEFLQKQPEFSTNNDYSSTLFTTTPRHFPHISVKLSLSNQHGTTFEARDLMDVLASASISRIDFKQLMPGTKSIEELRFRLNNSPTFSKRI
jgi:hypothetical protein